MNKLNDKKPEKCCDTTLEYKDSSTNSPDYKAIRATCSNCGKMFEQNLATNAVYTTVGKQFIHLNCNEEVDCVWRTHSIWDSPFECSGYGNVDKYPIPFCPKHEDKPSSQGFPIQC